MFSTVSRQDSIDRRNILNLAARIRKVFSIICLALESLYLKFKYTFQIRGRVRLQKIVSHWESISPNKNISEQKLTFPIVLLWLRQIEVIIYY